MCSVVRPFARQRVSAGVACLLLVGLGVAALRQRDLLDASHIDGDATSAARLLHERQRYGPGDAGEFDRLLREKGRDWADDTFHRLVDLAPTWAPYRYALGLIPLERGEWDSADGHFQSARALAPNYAGLAERIGVAWVRVAAQRRESKLLLYALPHFRDAARLDPPSLRRTFRLLGPVVGDLRQLAALVPDTAAGHAEFGTALEAAGFAKEAMQELSRAIEEPGGSDADVWLALGRAHLSLGNLDHAEEAFREAIRRSADPDARIRAIYDVYVAAGRAGDGLALWRHLADEHPRGARFNLGRSGFERGPEGHAAAIAEFRAIDDVARDPPTTGYLARIEIAGRRFADARSRLQRAVRLHPRDADLHYLLALALRGTGDATAAGAELARALELNPANETFIDLRASWDDEDRRR